MVKVKNHSKKAVEIIKTDGVSGLIRRGSKYAYYKKFPDKRKKTYKDILFINGCELPHPQRYRVDHQVEQLLSSGLSVDTIYYGEIKLEMLKYYRGFVFFRCPITDTIREFLKTAKSQNKISFFDIDDLVVDTKYTNQIDYVRKMSKQEKSTL
jgi:O-antigen biosynthesis protein